MLTDEEAAVMVERNQGLVYKACNEFIRSGYFKYRDFEDLCQEGRIALWNAAKRYNPEIGAFSTYAYPSIQRRYLTLYNHSKIERILPESYLIYADGIKKRIGEKKTSLWNLLTDDTDVEKEALSLSIDDIRELALDLRHSERDVGWFVEMLKGVSNGTTAKRCGMSRQNVNYYIVKVRRDVATLLDELYFDRTSP